MCGIAGIVSSDQMEQRKSVLAAQLESLEHRGPDGSGEFCDENCMMGMRRLAIVDLKEGHQPSFSCSSKMVVVFNGEIYNYRELAKSINHECGHSVTEARVIADLFEKFGIDCFKMLDGFFAIAVWDRQLKRLVLARDRIGKKPLFYGINNSVLYFGSEAKAILRAGFPTSVNKVAVCDVLKYGYPRGSNSAYEGIYQIAPGSGIDFHKGKAKRFNYWLVKNVENEEIGSFEQAKTKAGEHLLRSVEKRLISERPVGIFLSGGIDSSLVATAVRELGRKDIETYSVGFTETKYDESGYARRVSEHLGLKFNQINVVPDPEFFFNVYPRIMDFPFADSSFLPTYLLSEFASKTVKVALSGDGGDEAFGGYNRYQVNLKLERLFRGGVGKLLPDVTLKDRLNNKLYRAMKFSNFELRYDSMMRLFENRVLSRILHPNFKDGSINLNLDDDRVNSKSYLSSLLEMQRDDFENYLPGDLLVKMDMASMSNGLEVRSPFLDSDIIKFGLSLPEDFKINKGVGKYILRELLADNLPRHLFERPKQGFAIPRAEWLRGPLRDSTREILLSKKCREREWFSSGVVEKILNRHDQGWNLDELIWPLLMVELWAINWLDS